MTKTRCKICEVLGESEITREHGLSDPCHLSSLQQLNHFGLSYIPNSNINYANHGLLNGLYLPQLKDMMLAAYLLRGNISLNQVKLAVKFSNVIVWENYNFCKRIWKNIYWIDCNLLLIQWYRYWFNKKYCWLNYNILLTQPYMLWVLILLRNRMT